MTAKEGARFESVTSPAVLLVRNDIDTDQIIPARYLKVTDKKGLGDVVFADWRFESDGTPKADFPLNQPEAQGCQVLIAGNNFGCGSSREHAPWSLVGFGFRAVIALGFADIFKGNALKNGLVPVILPADAHAALVLARTADPQLPVTVDLVSQTVSWPGHALVKFPVDAFARKCLLQGVDELGYLQGFEKQVVEYERKHAY
jgi:3-isopropylmalate/(R)-2-methylmalate dehydratase small subunit